MNRSIVPFTAEELGITEPVISSNGSKKKKKKGGYSQQFTFHEKNKSSNKTIASILVGVSVLVIAILLFARGSWDSNPSQNKGSANGKKNPVTVLQFFEYTKVNVGENFKSKLIIRNHSNTTYFLYPIDFSYDSDKISVSKVKLAKKYYLYAGIHPGEQCIVPFVFKAVKTGTTLPPVARFNYKKNYNYTGGYENPKFLGYSYYLPQNHIPHITVTPVRLPGIDYPLTSQFKKTKDFYNLFVLKLIGIVLLIIVIFYGFIGIIIYSNIVESPLGRISIPFLMALVAACFLPFVYQGILWVWRTSLPPLTHFILILTVSMITTIRLRFHLLRNVILDSLISGSLVSFISYLIYVGFKAYQHNGFAGFSVINVLAMSAVIGIAANAYFLRKYRR